MVDGGIQEQLGGAGGEGIDLAGVHREGEAVEGNQVEARSFPERQGFERHLRIVRRLRCWQKPDPENHLEEDLEGTEEKIS